MTRKPDLRVVESTPPPEPVDPPEPEAGPKVASRYLLLYRAGERNFCPGCGREHWFIGRATAECAFCQTAVELADAVR